VRNTGFSIVELLIASAITMAVVGAVLAVVNPAQLMFRAQGDAADLHQRLRAAADTVSADVRAAMAVRPYRVGAMRDDAAIGVYYRTDTLTVLGVPSTPLALDGSASRTYYLRSAAPGTFQLMQYDGESTDLPVVEHVVALAFDYLADEPSDGLPAKLPPGQLTDGPWLDDASGRRYDADLLRVTLVRIRMRLESADASTRGQPGALFMHAGTSRAAGRLVPDAEIELDVAVRNLRRDP